MIKCISLFLILLVMLHLSYNCHLALAENTSNLDELQNMFDEQDVENDQNVDDKLPLEDYLHIEDDPDFEDELNIEDDYKGSEETDANEISYDARFTLKQQFGYKYQDPHKFVANRSSARLEMTSNFKSNYLLLFDGKVTYYFPQDHLSDASNSDSGGHFATRLREMYLQASYDSLSFKLGKQIIKWGVSEISVVDKISPENMEELYLTESEDSRIGQLMMEIEYFGNGQEFIVFANPDSKVEKLPSVNTEYYIELPEDDPGFKVKEELPEDLEYGLRYKRYLSNSDLSLLIANLNDNEALYIFNSIEDDIIHLDKKYGRYQMLAIAGNLNLGNILIKGELAFKLNKRYVKTVLSPNDAIVERNSVDFAMDMEYLAINNMKLRCGVSNSHIINWDNTFDKNENENSFFFGLSKSFLNETLASSYLLTYEQDTRDVVHKLETEYFFKNDVSLKMDIHYFEPKGDHKFLEDSGRITAEIVWYF